MQIRFSPLSSTLADVAAALGLHRNITLVTLQSSVVRASVLHAKNGSSGNVVRADAKADETAIKLVSEKLIERAKEQLVDKERKAGVARGIADQLDAEVDDLRSALHALEPGAEATADPADET